MMQRECLKCQSAFQKHTHTQNKSQEREEGGGREKEPKNKAFYKPFIEEEPCP